MNKTIPIVFFLMHLKEPVIILFVYQTALFMLYAFYLLEKKQACKSHLFMNQSKLMLCFSFTKYNHLTRVICL